MALDSAKGNYELQATSLRQRGGGTFISYWWNSPTI